jgi:hypothetical protein
MFLVFAIHVSVFAQWKTSVVDDSFDKYIVSLNFSKDNGAEASLVLLDGKLIFSIMSDLNFEDHYNDVEITFKLSDGNKEYKITGGTPSNSKTLVLLPKNGVIGDAGNLLKGEFLSDFKKAISMKVKISYDRYYKGYTYKAWETFVFDMSGSTNAYNRVSTQK